MLFRSCDVGLEEACHMRKKGCPQKPTAQLRHFHINTTPCKLCAGSSKPTQSDGSRLNRIEQIEPYSAAARSARDMATIADELLNDFEDSGDENEEQEVDNNFFGEEGVTSQAENGVKSEPEAGQNGAMELDGDEEEPGDEDLDGTDVPAHLKKEEEETEEETKARVEKMELQSVSDVRSVAGLMKQLDPLLKVSPSPNHTYTLFVVKQVRTQP